MANRKVFKYSWIFVLSLVTSMLFFSIHTLAAQHYILYNGEIEVVMPDDYKVVTRADLRNIDIFKDYGLEDEKSILEYMESENIYLEGIDYEGDSEIIITVTEGEKSLDFTNMDDDVFFELKDSLVEEIKKSANSTDMTALAYKTHGVRYIYLRFDMNLNGSSQNRVMYCTAKDGLIISYIYTRLNPNAMLNLKDIDEVVEGVTYKTTSEHPESDALPDDIDINNISDVAVKNNRESSDTEKSAESASDSGTVEPQETAHIIESSVDTETVPQKNTVIAVLFAVIGGVVLAGLLRWLSTRTTKESENSQGKLVSSEESEKKMEKTAETPKILYCKKCGKKLLEGGKFCRFCGTNNGLEGTGSIPKQNTAKIPTNVKTKEVDTTPIVKTQRTAKSSDPFIEALEKINSSDKNEQTDGRWTMGMLVSSDPRAMYWAAQEYEKQGGLCAAANYYENAFKHGIAEAKEGYLRCYNPYHHPTTFDIFEDSRGCGTPFIESERKTTEKQKQDFAEAFKTVNDSASSKEDLKKAVQTIYQIATASGCDVPEAQLWLADYYEHVAKDDEQAARWYRAAAYQGLAEGARCYADMLMVGKGVEQNQDEAIKYYKIASDKGIPEAQFVMAQYYLHQGKTNKAKHLFILSAQAGFGPAREMLASHFPRKEANVEADDSNKLDKIFRELAKKYDLGMSPEKAFPEIYQPDDFCEKAYDYCNKQYAEKPQKLLYEYCMTAFYGCICTAGLYTQDKKTFENGTVWDTLYKHINVEFTDSNAERLLGTRRGEEKAENIYAIIKEYIDTAMWVMSQGGYEKSVCLEAMKGAYDLGMLVAEKEL